jgi:glycosyltransferase involved in cell wall biosynthesis
VLAIYLEPAPYIVGFLSHVREAWNGGLDIAYVGVDVSQPWGYQLRPDQEALLPKGFAAAVGEVWRRIARGRYALIHLAGWGHPVLMASLLLGKLYRIPVTVESDTPAPHRPPAWKGAIKRLVYPWLFSLPDSFLPGGLRQAAYLRDYGVPEDRIQIAQMTVDVEQIRRQIDGRRSDLRESFRERFRIGRERVCILYVGRLESHKGIEDLLHAYRVVSRPGLMLLVVGNGSLRATVQAAEKESEWIRYAGRLSGDEIWQAYCAADFLVVPSRAEPWGLVVNEAMAMGLPVIVSDRVGCIDDLVQDEGTGLIVPAESPEALAEAIVRLADAPQLRTKLGAHAARLISAWTLRNQADRTVMTWRTVLD